MRLALAALVLSVPVLPALQAAQEPREFLAELSSAMARQQDEFSRMMTAAEVADLVIRRFDPSMPKYDEVRSRLFQMLAEANASSDIDILAEDSKDDTVTFILDWGLQLEDRANTYRHEQRRERVTLKIRRFGKRWKVVEMNPITLFGPMTAPKSK